MSITSVLRLNKIPALQASLNKKAAQNVSDAAESCAKLAVALAPIRTGALKASIYVSGPGDKTDYPEAITEAFSLNPLADVLDEITPEMVDTPGPNHPVAVIAPSVHYAMFQELGTRYMAPQPFLFPAAEVTRAQFESQMIHVADF